MKLRELLKRGENIGIVFVSDGNGSTYPHWLYTEEVPPAYMDIEMTRVTWSDKVYNFYPSDYREDTIAYVYVLAARANLNDLPTDCDMWASDWINPIDTEEGDRSTPRGDNEYRFKIIV